jgi:hypothetical protein
VFSQQGSGNRKSDKFLTDVAAHTPRMLHHAQPGLRLLCLKLPLHCMAISGPPLVGWQDIPSVRMSISSFTAVSESRMAAGVVTASSSIMLRKIL